MKKVYLPIVVIILPIAVGMLFYKPYNGKPSKQIPISYDKQHIEKLNEVKENHPFWKQHGFVLKKVNELGDSLTEIYNVTGENGIGWDDEGGDFKRIKIKPKNGHASIYDHGDGGWLKILEKSKDAYSSIVDRLKLPENSTKLQLHPYGITLDIGEGNRILMLFGYQYATDPARLLTLIYIGKDQAELIFNKHFNLFEIRENKGGYSLIGRTYSDQDSDADPYEIAIKDGKLTFGKLPLQKIYENKDPHIILYNAIGWADDAQPGEFTRLEIAAPPESKVQENHVFHVTYYNDTWTPFPAPIKLPTHTTTIHQTPYFIILENQNGRIIILNERDHRDRTAGCLTILKSSTSYPTSLFNGYFHLQEIRENDTAYHLLGTVEIADDPHQIHEITINKASMAQVECDW